MATAKAKTREAERQQILSGLIAAVKACQIRFGGQRSRTQLATEEVDGEDGVVAELCQHVESAFHYGLKQKKRSDLATGLDFLPTHLVRSFSIPTEEPTFWSFAKTFLSKSELDRFYLLKNVKTDLGRGRAFLRSTLNEKSLEKYLSVMLSKETDLRNYYEDWSFLLDPERTAILTSLAAGLTSIVFAINLDKNELNDGSVMISLATSPDDKDVDKDHDGLVAEKSFESSSLKLSNQRRKKRRARPQIISFDDEKDKQRESEVEANLDSQVAETNVRCRDRKARGNRDDLTNLEFRPVNLSHRGYDIGNEIMQSSVVAVSDDDEDDGATSVFTNSSKHDISAKSASQKDRGSSVTSLKRSLQMLTPMGDKSVGELIPVTASGHVLDQDVQSEDSMSLRSHGEESDYASVCGASEQRFRHSSKSSSIQSATVSRENLKQALLSVMERKDELQAQCVALKKLLSRESEGAAALREELSETNRSNQENLQKLELKIQSIARENELLKHQLKKYVGAVQQLREGRQAYETLAQLEKPKTEGSDQSTPKYIDYHYEASEYEKKLIQVAEMHGELIEFNEYLQRTVQAKDAVIARMREELVDLRGPLPREVTDDDAVSLASDGNWDNASLSSGPTSRALLHIWIPSVFLSGSGGRTHHVYQVYLRLKDEEWNIYRRYSDFLKLHTELSKQEKQVAGFDFPPKKTVGNKAEKVVEDRRRRLQTYLRKIVNLLVQTNPSLVAKPSKENVLMLMPFLGETYFVAVQQKKERQEQQRQQKRSHSQPRSLFTGRRSNATPTPQLAL